MAERRAYVAGTAINPGTAVVQGGADNEARAPGKDGKGDFLGLYAWEANEPKAKGEAVGIVLSGTCKALAGGNVAAGKPAAVKADDSGSLVVPAEKGTHAAVGIFLESGSPGEYVDVLVARGSATV
ncbi:MAG: hypothetical protein FWD94_01175 [Treponema sp.]|nr:hypothetical protein [Treponema sp.]